jgi:hypothetical protein
MKYIDLIVSQNFKQNPDFRETTVEANGWKSSKFMVAKYEVVWSAL